MFVKATKSAAKLRLALAGPSGAGKTFTALTIGEYLAAHEGGEQAVIDTENGSASKYADRFAFSTAALTSATTFAPEKYVELIDMAEEAGFPVIVIDSLSHEWAGRGGILELVDQAAARMNGNKFNAWGVITPRHDRLVRRILEAKAHVIVTLRAKMEYVQEKNERGRTEVRAVGMKPIQRDELEYEFDIFGMLDQDNNLVIRKSRCPDLAGAVIHQPGREMAETLIRWLAGAGPSGQPRQRPRATRVTVPHEVAPDPVAATVALTGGPGLASDGVDAAEPDEPTDAELAAIEAEEVEEAGAAPPSGSGRVCGQLQCETRIAPDDEFVYRGKRIQGAYILRRSEEEAGFALCPEHLGAWIKGDDIPVKPEIVRAAS